MHFDDSLYVLDEIGTPTPIDNQEEWVKWFTTANWLVNRTDCGQCGTVLTLFLGINYNWCRKGPPMLWETLVCGSPNDGDTRRYPSLEAAKTGHEEMVAKCKRNGSGPQLP